MLLASYFYTISSEFWNGKKNSQFIDIRHLQRKQHLHNVSTNIKLHPIVYGAAKYSIDVPHIYYWNDIWMIYESFSYVHLCYYDKHHARRMEMHTGQMIRFGRESNSGPLNQTPVALLYNNCPSNRSTKTNSKEVLSPGFDSWPEYNFPSHSLEAVATLIWLAHHYQFSLLHICFAKEGPTFT